jgi:hypothetical protein
MDSNRFKKALAAAPGSRFVLVTDQLFWQLYDAMELTPRKVSWRAPQDGACTKIMNALLASQHLPRAHELAENTWHMNEHDILRVIHGLTEKRDTDGRLMDFEVY